MYVCEYLFYALMTRTRHARVRKHHAKLSESPLSVSPRARACVCTFIWKPAQFDWRQGGACASAGICKWGAELTIKSFTRNEVTDLQVNRTGHNGNQVRVIAYIVSWLLSIVCSIWYYYIKTYVILKFRPTYNKTLQTYCTLSVITTCWRL